MKKFFCSLMVMFIFAEQIFACLCAGEISSSFSSLNSTLSTTLNRHSSAITKNIEQAKTYQNLLEELNYDKSCVIFLDIDKDLALKRTISRIVCPNCGSSYNLLVEDKKTQKENICDRCHHELKSRKDDTEEVFLHRFDTYLNSTKEVIDYYKELGMLHKIEVGEKSANEIFDEIKKVLND